MNTRRTLGIAACALAALAAGIGFGLARFSTDTDKVATSLLFAQSWPDTHGRTVAMDQYRGKALVVNFWATWCPPCVEEIPEFSRLNQEYSAFGIQFVGIAIDNAANVVEFSKKVPASYPYLVAGASATELARRLGNSAGALPYTLVLRADGSVHAAKLGRLHEAELRTMLNDLKLPR